MRTPVLFSLLFVMLLAAPAQAQMDNRSLLARLDSLERNVQLVQRQLARGETGGAPDSTAGYDYSTSGAGVARAEARIAALEEQLRTLQGQIDENNYQNRQLSEKVDSLSKEMDYRFSLINPSAPPAQGAAETPTATTTAAENTAGTSTEAQTPAADDPNRDANTSGSLNLPKDEQSAAATMSFETPREHYNYAFRLLNQAKYAEASEAFKSFTQKYPKDPLTGNAFYWLGETYYVQRDYIKAADNFRQGFETAPTGPKAADNLLKLSMTLGALNRNKEACVVLEQLLEKFGNASTAVKKKAQDQMAQLSCQG